MKKILLMIMMVLLCACGKKDTLKPEDISEDPIRPYFISLPSKPVKEDGILIVANDETINYDLWETFMDEVDNGQNTSITIARYTIDSGLLYELLVYNGDSFIIYSAFASNDPQIEKENYPYLYFTRYETVEDNVTLLNSIAGLSYNEYPDQETFMSEYQKMTEGANVDIYVVWGDSRPQ